MSCHRLCFSIAFREPHLQQVLHLPEKYGLALASISLHKEHIAKCESCYRSTRLISDSNISQPFFQPHLPHASHERFTQQHGFACFPPSEPTDLLPERNACTVPFCPTLTSQGQAMCHHPYLGLTLAEMIFPSVRCYKVCKHRI